MNNLEQFYAAIGSDAKPVIGRFCGNADMAKRFIIKFTNDSSFGDLTQALTDNRTDDAFRAAHTLKGICLNLGFDKLSGITSCVTELLRNVDLSGAKNAFPELQEEYHRVTDAVNTLLK